MDSKSPLLSNRKVLMDPLGYLPCSKVVQYRAGKTIYSEARPSANIHLVIEGKVTVLRPAGHSRRVVLDIYESDEFFGESAFVGGVETGEIAIALETTRVMMWTADEIEEVSARRPELALALLQRQVLRSRNFLNRIESFATENMGRRLTRVLLSFAARFGSEKEDGWVQMMPVSHKLFSEYVGTSRELVTACMNRLRAEGHVQYSRKSISVHVNSLAESLRSESGVERKAVGSAEAVTPESSKAFAAAATQVMRAS